PFEQACDAVVDERLAVGGRCCAVHGVVDTVRQLTPSIYPITHFAQSFAGRGNLLSDLPGSEHFVIGSPFRSRPRAQLVACVDDFRHHASPETGGGNPSPGVPPSIYVAVSARNTILIGVCSSGFSPLAVARNHNVLPA